MFEDVATSNVIGYSSLYFLLYNPIRSKSILTRETLVAKSISVSLFSLTADSSLNPSPVLPVVNTQLEITLTTRAD